MAPVKKTTNPEPKPKAVPAKAQAKPDAVAPAKVAGTPKKALATPTKTAENSTAVEMKAKSTAEKNAPAMPAKKGAGPKKPAAKTLPDKPGKKQKLVPEPAVIAAPAASVADVPKAAAPKMAAVPPAATTVAPKAAASAAGLPTGHVETVLQAVKEGRAIELIFKDADADPPRTFEPRQLIFDTLTQAWFVWGWDRRYNAERHHRLDQMAEINLVDGPGRSAQGPYKEGTPPNLIGGWLGGEPIRVKATLQKQWIFAVKQAPPAFPEFKIEDGEDGKATVSFVATDLRAIARWCLQFGEGIQVMEPQRLVDRVKQVGVAWVGKPVVAAPAPAPRPAPQPPPRTEHKPEHKPEHKSEHRREHGKDREDTPKKGSRVEIRIEKL
jgi:predicted DNA-binding transcriptional regulator YafY